MVPELSWRKAEAAGQPGRVAGTQTWSNPSTLSSFMKRFLSRSTSSLSTVARGQRQTTEQVGEGLTVGPLDNVVQDLAGVVTHRVWASV
jgi:hypothetical protein